MYSTPRFFSPSPPIEAATEFQSLTGIGFELLNLRRSKGVRNCRIRDDPDGPWHTTRVWDPTTHQDLPLHVENKPHPRIFRPLICTGRILSRSQVSPPRTTAEECVALGERAPVSMASFVSLSLIRSTTCRRSPLCRPGSSWQR
jgi:hypothetical protein